MVHTHNLPANPEPEGTICVPLFIPDDPTYVGLLLRALRVLTLDRHYDRDDAHTAITVRRVWSERTLAPLVEMLTSGDNCMYVKYDELCGLLADCNIVPGTKIYNSIINMQPDAPIPEDTSTIDIVPDGGDVPVRADPPGCDKDALWAGIREIVTRADAQGRDFIEELALINDKVEGVQRLIDLIPVLGDTIADITKFFTEATPDILNAYNAFSDPVALDVVACDLFEMVCLDCRYPTYEEIFNYFADNSVLNVIPLARTFRDVTPKQLWEGVKAVSIINPAPLWYTIQALQAWTLGIDGKFKTSYGRKTFQIWASFGEDLPNNNWEILCDGCSEAPVVPDLLVFNQINNSAGLFSLDCGVQQTNHVTGQKCANAWVDHDYSATINVDYGEMKTLPVGTKLEFKGYWQSLGGKRIRITLFDATGTQVHQERIDPLRFSTRAAFTNIPPFQSMIVDWTDGDTLGGRIESVEFGYTP